MAAQIVTGRTTRNSAKAAEEATAILKTPTNQEKEFNEAFAETPNPSFHTAMAGMQEILKAGNYLNEAFSDRLSLDEKLSLIITELYKIKDSTANTEENVKILQQQVQSHDQALKQAGVTDLENSVGKLEILETKTTTNESDVMDLRTEVHGANARISALEEQVDLSNRDVALLKGFSEKHEKQLDIHHKNTTQLVARSMNKNFTISGILESPRENCARKVLDFLRAEMLIKVEVNEIKVAHRLGYHNSESSQTKPRLMVVKVSQSLKQRIFQNKHQLKGKYNAAGSQFFVNLQIPEAHMAEKKALAYEVNRIKKFNEFQRNKEDKIKFEVKGKQLYVEQELHVQNVFPPRPLELFVSPEEQEAMDNMDFVLSQPKTKGGSIFVGLAVQVTTLQEVNRAYRKVRQMYPSYDHAMLAYRIKDYSGYQDDGEHAAGIKMHALVYSLKKSDIAVFVVRNFGGSHLGPRRFDYILEVAERAIKNLNIVADNQQSIQSPMGSTQSINSMGSEASTRSDGSRSSYNSAPLQAPLSNPSTPPRPQQSQTQEKEQNFPEVAPEFIHQEDWNASLSQEQTSEQLDSTVIQAQQERD